MRLVDPFWRHLAAFEVYIFFEWAYISILKLQCRKIWGFKYIKEELVAVICMVRCLKKVYFCLSQSTVINNTNLILQLCMITTMINRNSSGTFCPVVANSITEPSFFVYHIVLKEYKADFIALYFELLRFWGFRILFRVIILVFRTISQQLNSKTEIGPGLEQFKQIRTNVRFSDPI